MTRSVPRFVSALLCGAVAAWAGASGINPSDPDLDVPADGEVIATLRRIQARSSSLLPGGQAFPQRTHAAATWMAAGNLSPFDRAVLDYRLPAARREAAAWLSAERGHSFFLSPAAEAGFRSESAGDSSGMAGLTGVGASVYGSFSSRLVYYSRGMAYTEFTDRAQFSHQFSPEFGETYAVEKRAGDSLFKERTFNRFEHYVILDLPWLALKAGRDRVHLGPGYFSTLTASRETPPYYLLEARVDFAPWLRLDDYLLRMTDTRHGIRKYAHIHRFEFRPVRSLSLAFQDIVVYQDRGPDWRYALPLTPLAFSEDNLGGGDNDGMSFDFLWSGLRNFSLWGELFIDDLLSPTAFFDDFWENRWSALAGFLAVSPWPAFDADLVVEYSQVEPWTYIGRSPQTSFKHFNVPSASKLGPDSRSLDVQVSWRPAAWLEWKERWESNAKGVGRQATLGAVHDDALDGTTKELLGEEVRSYHVLRHGLGYLYRGRLRAEAFWDQAFRGLVADRAGFLLTATW